MMSSGVVRLSETRKKELIILSELGNENFLTVWDSSLKRMVEKKNQEEKCLPYYTVERAKDDPELHVQMLCGVLELSVQENIKDEELVSLLTSSGLQEERARLIMSQREHLQELVSSRIQHGCPREQLVDLQWKFGVVAGSSLDGEAGRTFVQVKLVSRTYSGALKSRHMEMSLQKFYDFLHQLEKAKASLDYMN